MAPLRVLPVLDAQQAVILFMDAVCVLVGTTFKAMHVMRVTRPVKHVRVLVRRAARRAMRDIIWMRLMHALPARALDPSALHVRWLRGHRSAHRAMLAMIRVRPVCSVQAGFPTLEGLHSKCVVPMLTANRVRAVLVMDARCAILDTISIQTATDVLLARQ